MPSTHAADFLALHRRPETFVLPNVWDAGSAKVMAQAGFPALGTTSAGIAFSAGLPDDGSIGREAMLERIAAIAAAVHLPVSADIESGYADDARGVGGRRRRCARVDSTSPRARSRMRRSTA
jgi:2-methylisocitrate lyase-like PEP mutase family enzyme